MVSMATEMVPVVDLRVLSQSDLDALAVASAHAVAPGSSPDAEPLPPLKIDRAVFNESAGSRKQTFTRLRLGNAAGSSSSAPTAIDTSPPATAPSAGNDPGNNLIAYHLRSLFARDDPSRPSSPPPPPETLALALLGTSHSPPRSPSPDPDRQTTNSKGISVDLVRLAELDGLYDEELGKRTAGLMSEAELMGFIKGLGGKWVSQRKKRKFVDASFFGDHLPSGWKLQLGLKRKARQAWVHCLSYVSPTGRKFASCKEVSAYLMSLLGYPEVRKVPIQHNSTGQRDLCDGDGDNDAAGFQHQVDSVVDNQNVLPVTSVAFSSHSSNSHDTRSACKYRNNSADYTGVTVPKIANQLDGRIGGLPEVADFNDQAGSYNDFRPTILANANHYKDQITDRGLAASKHGGVNNTVKARDVNLNSCLATISFPIASANNETSISLDDTNQSSIAGKCFSGSFNNNDGASTTSSCSGSNNKVSGFVGVSNGSSNASRCVSASHGDDAVANTFSNKNNTMVYHSSLSTHPTSPVATGVDCFPSRSAHPKDSDKEGAYGTRMDAMQNRTSNAAGFSAEAYNSGIYTADVTGRNCAQFNSSFSHLKPNTPSRCSQPESNTLTANNFTKGIDVNCMNGSFVHRSDANNMKGSFVNRPISNNEPNGYVHSMMGKPSNAMQNHYNGAAPSCAPLSAANTSQNVNGLMSMQANFGSMSTLVHSVGDVPRSSTTKDQCDLQLGFGGQKQQISARYGDLSPAASGSTQLGGMGRNNNLPAGSSQFGSMARPNSLPAGFSQFGSMARPNSLPAGSSQFGSMARPNSLTGGFSQFGSLASSNYLQTGSSQFGRMAGPNSIGPADSSQFGRMAGPNSRPPAESSQFGSMARPNSRPPAESSQFGSMANQNFVRTSEPTLQMGSGPRAQSGWDLNLSRMVNGGGMTLEVCMWCNGQYHHFGPVEQTQALICPSCRDKMALQGLVPNDGSWQP
ncbi:hypothetical protein BRADI_3g38747v3 [Brachypodium distachyon]|uniref:MBD domain-containing protein n=1 Tax=Brachypodium distachyon TaxID=15368 RepID=A0A0Q3HYX9_BRADI|nr:hypothetical protein BRADI_3g38747v3 [Brachypodium distachyon]